jgi:hypothetical protein
MILNFHWEATAEWSLTRMRRNNIQMNLGDIDFGNVKWMELAQYHIVLVLSSVSRVYLPVPCVQLLQ